MGARGMKKIGLIGTGEMAQAMAVGFLYEKVPVMFGSRSEERAQEAQKRLVDKMGEDFAPLISGGTQQETIEQCDLLFLVLPFFVKDGQVIDGIAEFIQSQREHLVGKNKTLCDLCNPYFRVDQGVNPFATLPPIDEGVDQTFSGVEYHKKLLNDPSTNWTSGFKVIYAKSLIDKNYQPIEICGDQPGLEAVKEAIELMGHSALIRGDISSAPLLEPR